jgi:D-alanyl-D-alanine carboxypeptidase (penicillin-binding protein 5/6)
VAGAAALAVLGGVFVGAQLLRGLPVPSVVGSAPSTWRIAGRPPALPWPAQGEAEVEVPGVGSLGSSGPAKPAPIASMAKVMTALVVLHDHPLAPGAQGPSVVATPADAALYQADAAANDSVAPVSAGQVASELELLEELLVPSADNVAVMLADWDAGSEAAFVAEMNRTAASLGMRSTHYADPAGLDPATASTPADQLRLEQVAEASPVLARIVRQPQMTLPSGQVVYNYNGLVGHDGVVGVKTGSSPEAGGSLMLAARAEVAGRPLTIDAVVLGQQGPSPLDAALAASRRLLDAARGAISVETVGPSTTRAAELTRAWGAPIPAVPAHPVQVIGWAGLSVRLSFRARAVGWSEPAGATVGTLGVRLGAQHEQVAVRTEARAAGPPLTWRLRRL